MNPYTLLHQ